ncbi:MAG: amidohydrolase family protein, partial [Bacteroidota bacterium]
MNIHLTNIRQLVTVSSFGKKVKCGSEMRELHIIENAGVITANDTIAWLGEMRNFPTNIDDDVLAIDCTNKVVMPGFIDAHTHILFAGSREEEFAMRAEGLSYQDIAARGGGIVSTMSHVRTATKKELKKNARKYLLQMLRQGTTSVEIKSGYGLDFHNEIKMLECIRELQQEELPTIVSTFLGAHAYPPEFRERKNEYVQLILDEMLPYIGEKHLAEFCDVF